MVRLDYMEANVFGGMPRTQDTITLDEYMYACGLFPPRHPVPALIVTVEMRTDPDGVTYIWMHEYRAWKTGHVRKGLQYMKCLAVWCSDVTRFSDPSDMGL